MKLHINHTVSVQLDPDSLALLTQVNPQGPDEPSASSTHLAPCHVLPLVQVLYFRARSSDGRSNPSQKTTVDAEWYEAFHHLRTLLASLDVRLFFPDSLDHPEVRVEHACEQQGISESEILEVIRPGLYCSLTDTYIAPAHVAASIPAADPKEVVA